MAVLTGAITYLSLAGTPGPATYTEYTAPGSSRPDDGQFTTLQLSGTPGRTFASFVDKVNNNYDRAVSDTYLVVLTLGPVTDVDIDVDDAYTPVLTMQATAYLTRAVSDTLRPVVTMGVAALSKGGSTAKAGTDTYTPVLTLTSSLVHVISVSDTYTPVLTLSADALNKSDALTVADTYTPVLDLTPLLDTVVAQVGYSRSDSYVPILNMSATVNAAGDVDIIDIRSRPYWLIEIDVR